MQQRKRDELKSNGDQKDRRERKWGKTMWMKGKLKWKKSTRENRNWKRERERRKKVKRMLKKEGKCNRKKWVSGGKETRYKKNTKDEHNKKEG